LSGGSKDGFLSRLERFFMIQSRGDMSLSSEAESTLHVPSNKDICGDAGGDKGREALAVTNVWSLEPLVESVVDIAKPRALGSTLGVQSAGDNASVPRPNTLGTEVEIFGF
jgi:hypothetical protein